MRRLISLSLLTLGVCAGAARADDITTFRSPSGNIGCAIWTGEDPGARCDLGELTPSFRKAPADCDLDWGAAFWVGAQGKGQLACAGDSVREPGARVLPYGKSIAVGAFTCTSAKTGMTCTNGMGHGFEVSKGKQRVF